MKHLLSGASLVLVSLVVTPAAFATCDISQTKCWINGGKCNIQFKNKTGESGGSSGGTSLEQVSLAQTVQIKARKDNGNKAGNKLTIAAGAKNTMNIENKAKKDFDNIRISSVTSSETVADTNMTCAQVKAILDGNGTCNVFVGFEKTSQPSYRLGFQCDGGNVGGPPKNN